MGLAALGIGLFVAGGTVLLLTLRAERRDRAERPGRTKRPDRLEKATNPSTAGGNRYVGRGRPAGDLTIARPRTSWSGLDLDTGRRGTPARPWPAESLIQGQGNGRRPAAPTRAVASVRPVGPVEPVGPDRPASYS